MAILQLVNLVAELASPVGQGFYTYKDFNNTFKTVFVHSVIEYNQVSLTLDSNKLTMDGVFVVTTTFYDQFSNRPISFFNSPIPKSQMINTLDSEICSDLKYTTGLTLNYEIHYFTYTYRDSDRHFTISYQIEQYFEFYCLTPSKESHVVKSESTWYTSSDEFTLPVPYYPIDNEIVYTQATHYSTNFDMESVINAWINEEEAAYSSGFNDGKDVGYSEGFSKGQEDILNWTNLLKVPFDTIDGILQTQLLPGIKLWYIVAIPLVLSVIKFIMGFFR